MDFLHERVFDPVLNSTTAPDWMKRGVNKTIKGMENMSASEMIQYYWKAISSQNGARFSDSMNREGFTRFEDIKDEFANRFNDEWLKA